MTETPKPQPTTTAPVTSAEEMDAAHAEAGDGTLQGAVPAGLTTEQLRERAEQPQGNADAATD